MNRPSNLNNSAHRVITFLTREELDFLDRVGKDALFSAGTKLSRSRIISAIVNVVSKLQINGQGLSSKKELEARIINAMKNITKTSYQQTSKEINTQKEKGDGNNETIL